MSGLQSGNFSGPVGSTIGQQPYREGLLVREEQETFWGWTPDHGYVELRARGVVTPRSMVAVWMVGLEDRPERSAEICIAEMFGNAVDWTSDRAEFFVDGGLVRSCPRPPSYPMQMMLAVFDFPEESTGDDAAAVPSLVVDRVRAYQR